MLSKLILSEKDYECLTKGIALGVGTGVFIGTILQNIELFFAIGGVVGIIVSALISMFRRRKENRIK